MGNQLRQPQPRSLCSSLCSCWSSWGVEQRFLPLSPCSCSEPRDSAPGKQLPAGLWAGAGAGSSPGRGTPQCLLSNHLLPPCQEQSAHKQCRAPVRSTA